MLNVCMVPFASDNKNCNVLNDKISITTVNQNIGYVLYMYPCIIPDNEIDKDTVH